MNLYKEIKSKSEKFIDDLEYVEYTEQFHIDKFYELNEEIENMKSAAQDNTEEDALSSLLEKLIRKAKDNDLI